MPGLPTVRGVVLSGGPATAEPVVVGTDAWTAWLGGVRSFAYRGDAGTFTARREDRGGRSYWKAYRRIGGHLRTAYLGRTADLTETVLVAAAARLAPVPTLQDEPLPDPIGSTPDVITAKTVVPVRRAPSVHRAGLLDALDAPERPVVLVCAPAGWGKSTLLTQWAAATPTAVAWVALEPGDDGPLRFWALVAVALERARPGCGQAVAGLLTAASPPAPDVLLGTLVHALRRAGPCALVLEDLHLVTSPAVLDVLRRLAPLLPAGVRLLLAARRPPAMGLARLRAAGLLQELTAEDLRFGTVDAVALLEQVLGRPLAPADAAAVDRQAEGWAAGLHLAGLALRSGLTRTAAAWPAAADAALSDYLGEELLDHLPPALATFLEDTAVLSRFCLQVCTAISDGDTDVAALLDVVEREDLFVVRLDTTGWYRYHHLFTEVLRRRLRRTRPGRESQVLLRAAAWFEGAGDVPTALDLAVRAPDAPRVADLLERHADTLTWRRGDLARVVAWIGALPEELLRSRPRVQVLLAWCHAMAGRLAEAGELIPQVPSADADLAAIAEDVLCVHAYLALYAGRAQLAARLGTAALQRLPEAALGTRAIAALTVAQARRDDGGTDQESYAALGTQLARRAGDLYLACTGVAESAWGLLAAGRLTEAEQICRHAGAGRSEDRPAVPHLGVLEVSLALAQTERGRYREAVAGLERGLADLGAAGHVPNIAHSQAALGRALLLAGDPDAAEAALTAAQDTAGRVQSHAVRRSVSLAHAAARITLGDADGCAPWAQEVAALHLAEPADDLEQQELLVLAWWYVQTGQPHSALPVLARVKRTAGRLGRVPVRTEATVIEALALAAGGHVDRAVVSLAAAVNLAQNEQHVRPFEDKGPAMTRLVDRLWARAGSSPPSDGRFRRFVAHLRSARAPAGPPATAARLGLPVRAPALTPRETDVLRLVEVGSSNSEIAAALGISQETVKTHLSRVSRKVGAWDRHHCVVQARSFHLL